MWPHMYVCIYKHNILYTPGRTYMYLPEGTVVPHVYSTVGVLFKMHTCTTYTVIYWYWFGMHTCS